MSIQRFDGSAAQAPLIAALRDPALHGPDCRAVDVVETHISWVLLNGTHAYKIKKALRLAFLDFSTLAARRRCCDDELRLNRRLAPELYIDVVPITGSAAEPALGGGGAPIEYAVRMREFPQSALLSRIAARGELVAADVDALATTVAAFHRRIAGVACATRHGDPDEIARYADENFAEILACGVLPEDGAALAALRDWTRREHARLRPQFEARRARGFVRECHGDLHLANVARFRGEITVFDGIEYSEALRWIDVASEIAFTVMDLEDRGQVAFAHRFLNAYLEGSGDYAGLAVLRYYVVYRALVRAKVARLRASQLGAGTARDALCREFHDYVALALRTTAARDPALLVTHGASGCGKTTLAQDLVASLGAVRVRSDVERRRLFGLGPTQPSGSGLAEAIYAPQATRATYEHCRDLARAILVCGRIAIVDATCLARWQRDLFAKLAGELDLPFAIIDFRMPEGTLRARIRERRARGGDASEADERVLERQLANAEPLAPDELARAVVVDAELAPGAAPPELLLRIAARIGAAEVGLPARSPQKEA